jgi:hypothetical protein
MEHGRLYLSLRIVVQQQKCDLSDSTRLTSMQIAFGAGCGRDCCLTWRPVHGPAYSVLSRRLCPLQSLVHSNRSSMGRMGQIRQPALAHPRQQLDERQRRDHARAFHLPRLLRPFSGRPHATMTPTPALRERPFQTPLGRRRRRRRIRRP